MTTMGNEEFSRAVEVALGTLGTGLLWRPQEFVGTVTDLYDPDSPEATVLYAHASDELLRPFAEAARAGTTDALEQAAKRAELWLRDVRRVNADDANVVAWGIARGIAAHLGVGWSRNTNDGQSREDEATRSTIKRARAVLANSGATEEDVAGTLAAVRALPTGTQGRATLEPALEGRLGKLQAEREAEEDRRAEAARKRREERDRLLAEREARRKAAAHGEPASGPEPKPDKRWLGVLAVIACLVVPAALFAYSNSMTQTRASGANSVAAEAKVRADEGSVSGVEVRKSIAKYSWAELKELSKAIAAADSDKEGLKIAKEYHLVDSDGKLQGDTKAVKLTDGTKTSVRILDFRHDELADGGKAGITFEFADSPKTHCMNSEDTNEGGWEASEMRAWLNSKFLALLPDDLQSCIVPASKRTNNVGGDTEDDASLVTVTSDKLWLLSEVEVEGAASKREAWNAEGTQYKLYADEGDVSSMGVKYGAGHWWTRSCMWHWVNNPDLSNARFSAFIGHAGESSTKAAKRLPSTRLACYMAIDFSIDFFFKCGLPTAKNGVSPGFCF